jgi:uncharacterized protein (TIGR02466 family)
MIIDIFKTSIYSTNVVNETYKKYFINKLEKCIDEKKQNFKSNYGGFQTPLFNLSINNSDDLEKKLIDDLIINPCNIFLKQFKIIKPFQLNNLNYWVKKNYKGSSNKPHCHGFDSLSGVYYLNVPKNSGDLVFLNIDKTMCKNKKFIDDANFYSEFIIQPKEYDLILFFSDTIHYVQSNNSEEDRISMAFNINISEVEDA